MMLNVSGVPRRPVVLLILDGFGSNPSKRNNAVAEADTPNLDAFFSRYPHTSLNASGHAVGLPDGQMGNSEVGHLTLGAGSVIRQDIVRISDAIASGEFFNNQALLAATRLTADKQRPLHLIGLVSDGGVHSQIEHLEALIKLCRKSNVRPLLHMITDGRDTPPQSALNYLPNIEARLHESGGAIASITGRYYAMDRDTRWERTELAWRALVLGKGQQAHNAETAIRSAYASGDTDEFIQPILLPPHQNIEQGDPVIFFNFRKDRPRQLVAALADPKFKGFDRGDAPLGAVTCMMPYDRSLKLPYAFAPEQPETTLGTVLSEFGLAQFHCAETEKYAHVTYFFNGGRTTPYSGEKQLLVPSPKVATYDLKPSMSAREVADTVVGAIANGNYAFIVVNFANGDMVGHTAKRHAVLEAVETLDVEAARVLEAAENAGYSVLLTADHGNCEELVDPFTGEPHTQHTTYPVPCLVMDKDNWQLSCGGGLANVAPTILDLMGIPVPHAMQASSLLLRKLPGDRPESRSQPGRLRGAA
ncbi:MAG: 2,3-bisphosphoglycerate-independent phosphoglycerate mutase [Chromatiales bacterium]|jgi:2,3-bisphosphoglycerate-independent phosphoglycerate mutase